LSIHRFGYQNRLDSYKVLSTEERRDIFREFYLCYHYTIRRGGWQVKNKDNDKNNHFTNTIVLALRKILCKKKFNQTLPVKRADLENLLLIASFPEWERGMRAPA
jgi:hypothetical protein